MSPIDKISKPHFRTRRAVSEKPFNRSEVIGETIEIIKKGEELRKEAENEDNTSTDQGEDQG